MRYIDVTQSLKHGLHGVAIETARILSKDGWNAKTLHLYSHAGTHVDAPVHFEVNNDSIDHYPIHRFFTDCHVIDLNYVQPGYEIQISDLGNVKDELISGEGLIFRTGWSRFIYDPVYRNGLPGISKELAMWCVERGVATIGVEPPSVADVNNLELLTEIHRILLGGGIVIVEGLSNLEEIKERYVQLVALPLKIKDGDGAPCRAVVIEKQNDDD
jgi:arylformamidase